MATAKRKMATLGDKTKIAVVCSRDSVALKSLPADADCEFLIGNSMDELRAQGELKDCEALMFVAAGGDPSVMIPLWDECPQVKWVHSLFAGVDALAPFIKSRLMESEVPLSNGKGAFSSSLAEYVMAASLHFNKQVPRCLANRTERKWDKFVMDTMAGKTMGFVGFGHIAQMAARAAKAGLGMRIAALRRNVGKGDEYGGLADVTYGPDDKLKLFAESDFVVCVLPGTPATLDYCNAEAFAAMKESAVFISCGRGLAVDEVALAAALKSGSIKGAALDVFKKEPLPEESELWGCDNLLMTAHNADYTDDYFALGWGVWQSNLAALRTGEPLVTPVDKAAGY